MKRILCYLVAGIGAFAVTVQQETWAKKKKSTSQGAVLTVQDTAIRKETRQMPLFKGKPWNPAFVQWIANHLQYPETLMRQGLGGRVVARFVLEKDGSINQVEILESPYLLLSAEVIRVLGLSPK